MHGTVGHVNSRAGTLGSRDAVPLLSGLAVTDSPVAQTQPNVFWHFVFPRLSSSFVSSSVVFSCIWSHWLLNNNAVENTVCQNVFTGILSINLSNMFP